MTGGQEMLRKKDTYIMEKCYRCNKNLHYDFEIKDGICEECVFELQSSSQQDKMTAELERALSYEGIPEKLPSIAQ